MSSDNPLAAVAPGADQVEQTSFLALQAWLFGSPWRLTGGWHFVAGLVAAGGLLSLSLPWITLALGLVLCGMMWGALWTQLAVRRDLPLAHTSHRPLLPYVTPDSPAGRLAGWQRPGSLGYMVRIAVPLVGLALLLAYLMGRDALLATAAAIALTATGAAAVRAGLLGLTGALRALVVAGLPFALGVLTHGAWPDQPGGLWLAGLALGYVLLTAASEPGAAASAGAVLLIVAAAGVLAVVATLVAAGQPVAAVVMLLLAAPPLLSASRRDGAARGLGRSQAWWLAAVLWSSIALGAGIG